jgi:hypothetical protein
MRTLAKHYASGVAAPALVVKGFLAATVLCFFGVRGHVHPHGEPGPSGYNSANVRTLKQLNQLLLTTRTCLLIVSCTDELDQAAMSSAIKPLVCNVVCFRAVPKFIF